MWATLDRNGARKIGIVGAQQRDIATIAGAGGITQQHRAGCHQYGIRARRCGIRRTFLGARNVGAERDYAATGIAGCIDGGTRRYDHSAIGEHLYGTAFGACNRALREQIACNGNIAAHASDGNGAGVGPHTISADGATGIDKLGDQRVSILRGKRNLATISQNHAAIGNECRHQLAANIHRPHRFGDIQRNQPVAIHVQCKGAGTGKHHLAQFGGDDAIISHLRRNQPDQPGILNGDFTVIDDAGTGPRRTGEVQFARQEILVGDAVGGRHQRLCVNFRALGENNAGLVNQNKLSVRINFTGDDRGGRGQNIVQRRRCRGWLVELHRGRTTDIKRLPVDDGFLAGLVNGGKVWRLADGRTTGRDRAAGGGGVSRQALCVRRGCADDA